MDYKETLEYLFRQLPMFSRTGAAAYKPGLETSERLDEFFGHPHRNFKSIHVGGTNGKGSTSHMLAAMLQSHGYKTGLYTSPHLVDFRERIKVNGKMIPEEGVTDFVKRYLESGYEGHPSFFELTMMMAFDWFSRQGVDYAVIEVGMGGRLDSTNIISPVMSVITNISKDHTQFLGDTLERIASEKAGIIKKDVPVVIGEAEGAVEKVFLDKAEEMETDIILAYESDIPEMECGLKGYYQKANKRTAYQAARCLAEKCGVDLSEEDIRRGMKDVVPLTGLMGRWMKIGERPAMFCDTGHNEAGISYVLSQLSDEKKKERHQGGRLRMVIGFVADKAIDAILAMLPKDAEYYFTQAQIPRALPVAQLVEKATSIGLEGKGYPDVHTAICQAREEADKDNDLVFVGGSTFIVADALSVQ